MAHRWRAGFRGVALACAALVLAGCAAGGATSSDPAGGPGTGGPSGAAPSTPASPLVARTTPAVVAAQAALDGQVIAVTGFFTTDGTTHLVCDAILESYPPQCGGATIVVLGPIPPEALAMLESTSEPDLAEVSWGTVEIRGVLRATSGGGRPMLELTEIRVVV